MISLLLEAAVRSIAVALAVWAGLRLFRVRNVFAQKVVWGTVLAAALTMPVVAPWILRWSPIPASVKIAVPAEIAQWLPSHANQESQAVSQPLSVQEAQISTAVNAANANTAANQIAGPTTNQSDDPINAPIKVAAPAPDTSAGQVSSAMASSPSGIPASVVSHGYVSSAATLTPSAIHPVKMLTLKQWALLAYFIVAGGLIIRLMYGLAMALLLWLEATPLPTESLKCDARDLALRSSAAVASPVTIGSGVVLPEDFMTWDSEKLRIVLAHERSHVRQGDFYLQILAGLYSACTWFSPLGWWIKGKLSELAEAISDRAGLEQAVSPASYAQVLLEFAAAPRPTALGVAMARQGSLSRRIERLLNEGNFKQGFAGGRRALAAVLLVPIALIATTAFTRVRAAAQDPAQPAAAQSTPPPAAAPITGQSTPEPVVTADQPDATQTAEPEVADDQDGPVLAPKAPAMAPATPDAVAPVPPQPGMIIVAPRVPNVPMVVRVPPIPPIHVAVNIPQIRAMVHPMVIAADGRGYQFYSSDDGNSYAIISADGKDHMTFSGDIHTSEIDKARQKVHGDFLWFRRDGKAYFVDDPATIAQIKAMYAPMEELGKKQEELGRQQEELGRQQEEWGRKQEQASVPTPDMRKEMAEINETMAKLQAKAGKTVTQDELSELQDKLGELQGRLGEIQGEIGARQGEFGAEQGKLGAKQGELGAEQGKLGAEQGRIAREADRKVKGIIEESLKNGKAHPVE